MSEADPGHDSSPRDPGRLGTSLLFDQIRDAVVVADAHTGRVVLWNSAAAELFGYSAREAVGMPLARIVPPEYREQHTRGLARYSRTGQGVFIDSHTLLELPALRRDGERITVELRLSPLPGDDPDERLVLSIMRDVSDRIRMQQELERERDRLAAANDELRETNDVLESFTYVVSHDLREPTRAIDALLQAVEEDHAEGMPPRALELVRRARGADRRLRVLLDGLLEYSRVARDDLRLEALDVAAMLERESCRIQFQHLLQERRARLVVARDIPPVLATEAALCQILGNLVANAVRHNPRDRPEVRVFAPPRQGGPHVEIVVDDDGPGFSPRVLQAARDGDLVVGPGRGGFGLVIVRRAAARLGGTVALENRPEGGGRVRVRLLAPAR